MGKEKTKMDYKGYEEHIDYYSKHEQNHPIIFHNHQFTEKIKIFTGGKITFTDCIFDENLEIQYCGEEIIFKKCEFKKMFNSQNCKYKKNAKFLESIFNQVDFNNATFELLADFWSCTFNTNTIFYKTDFLGTTVFSAAIFRQPVLFTYTSISKVIIFRGTVFENGLDLSQAIISGNISLHDLKINEFKAVNNTESNKLYESYISEEGKIPYTNKRETYRILKQSLSKNCNEIESLEFRKREFQTFYNEIKSNLKNILLPESISHLKEIDYFKAYIKKLFTKRTRIKFKLLKLFTNLQNLIILILNFISNYFGVSWFVALLFILGIGGFFFLLSITEINEYYLVTNPKEWEWEHFKYFLEFLNPTHKFDYVQEDGLTTRFYLFDFIGRIFVGYGIYQFIQAFRKYK